MTKRRLFHDVQSTTNVLQISTSIARRVRSILAGNGIPLTGTPRGSAQPWPPRRTTLVYAPTSSIT